MDGYIRGMELAPSGSDSGALAFVLVSVAAMYFIPAVVAAVRKVPNRGPVVALNVLAGWTLVGWVAALAMAFRTTPARVHRRESVTH